MWVKKVVRRGGRKEEEKSWWGEKWVGRGGREREKKTRWVQTGGGGRRITEKHNIHRNPCKEN